MVLALVPCSKDLIINAQPKRTILIKPLQTQQHYNQTMQSHTSAHSTWYAMSLNAPKCILEMYRKANDDQHLVIPNMYGPEKTAWRL